MMQLTDKEEREAKTKCFEVCQRGYSMTHIDTSNPNKLLLKDLPDDVVAAIFLAWRRGERLESNAITNQWHRVGSNPAWSPEYIYRIAPAPVEPMTVRWDILPEEWLLAAKDENNNVFGFKRHPRKGPSQWISTDGLFRRLDDIGLATPGTVPWQDSLQRRPKGDRV